ncbi:MAG: 1,4-beta-xylanase [Flavobacteriaceae bacterium]|nr:1,4-beta-xylanase [Flavobacteriaceae bacterium]
MKKYIELLVLISTFHLHSQEIVTLEYDNTGLDYKGTEFKTQGSAPGEYKFNNISIPTIEIYLPKGKAKETTAMIVCPGGGMRSNAFFHEGTHVAKALNIKGIAAFVLKYRLVPSHLIVKKEELNEPYTKEKKQLSYAHLDALNAIQHLRNNAGKYNIDPQKIGIMGFSAGGAVSIEATYKSSPKNRPNFLAPIYPWMVIIEDQDPPTFGPPLFVVCTTADKLALAIPSAELYIDWAERGFISELHNYHHGDHGFGMRKKGYPVDQWFDNMINWISAIDMLN